MKVLTSNFPFNNWFRNKLERGVNLWEKDFKEIYQKKLSNPMAIASIGDINRGGFEVLVISKSIKIVPNIDKIAHMGGGL
jgi:ABC-type long-subunit fatty acid transport system fused permease/ATPase subunit